MVVFTQNEQQAILAMCKDPHSVHNATHIAQTLGISQWGAQKLLKRLTDKKILNARHIGTTIIYSVDLSIEYVQALVSFLLASQAQQYARWQDEFADFKAHTKVIVLYGSILENPKKANDIDILVLTSKPSMVNILVNEKNKSAHKPIHALTLTSKDFQDNLKKDDQVILQILKTGIVLHGQHTYVELLAQRKK